jgi:hypothetical protein
MYTTIVNTLAAQVNLLMQLSNSAYTNPIKELSNATIGQHNRHIIELFECLLNSYHTGIVDYDARQRNKVIETDITFAISCIETIIKSIEKPDRSLQIIAGLNGNNITIQSTYNREVYYNLEHCIHHQALIKVALLNLNGVIVSREFGVAPSTIQHKLQCAQ